MPLTHTESRARAALLSDIHTEVELDLTSTDDFGVRATIHFSCASPGADSFAELRHALSVTASLNGQEASYVDGRILLRDLAATNELAVTARMPFVTDGDGMTVTIDSADGERYACAFTGMDIAQAIIPCFDQPDLKTTFKVGVVAPEHWTVLANGPLVERDGGRWEFGETPSVASYLFFVAGGPWTSITWDEPYGDTVVPMGWHAMGSRRTELERDFDELKRMTSAYFQHFTTIFEPAYPFADYQQVFTPGLNWGAMEYPGCVAFRDEYLTPGAPTALEREGMAEVIAHEMSHMWFGDLVTMVWWEDSWLNESFADYMGYEKAATAAGYADSWSGVALGRKTTGYRADRRRSTHRIAEDAENLPDADTAFANFDMITYAKGGAVLRQLVTWLGEEDFLRGVNTHLNAHAFGNATLADFLGALDSATDRDVRGWAESWLRSTGFDRIVVSRDGDVPVLTREGSRPHRFTVAAYDDALVPVGERLVDLAEEPVRLEEFAGRIVLANAHDETFASVVPDEQSWAALRSGIGSFEAPLTRARLWWTAIDLTESGLMPVDDLVSLVMSQLAGDDNPVVFESVVDMLLLVMRRYGDPARTAGHLARVAGLARDEIGRGNTSAAALQLLARTSADEALLRGWLDGSSGLPAPDQAVRWVVVQRLAALGDPAHIEPELARDRTTNGQLAALTARAAIPTASSKAEVWERWLGGTLSNKEFDAVRSGFWGWEQADLVSAYVPRFAADAAALARRSGQAMGKNIGWGFPWLPLTDDQRASLRSSVAAVLDEDLPTVFARSLSDSLDDLDRVLATRRVGAK